MMEQWPLLPRLRIKTSSWTTEALGLEMPMKSSMGNLLEVQRRQFVDIGIGHNKITDLMGDLKRICRINLTKICKTSGPTSEDSTTFNNLTWEDFNSNSSIL